MTYNSKVLMEQGGSVLRVDSGGSISVQAGGTISGAGTIQLTGANLAAGGLTSTGAIEGASVTVTAGGPLFLGIVQIIAAQNNSPPTTVASPGSLYLRSDGSMSNLYVNVGIGSAGSVWKSASIYS